MNQTSDKSEYVIFSATELAEKMDDIEIQKMETYGGDTVETPFYEGKQVYLKLTGIFHRRGSGAEIRLGAEIDEQVQALLNIEQHINNTKPIDVDPIVTPPDYYKFYTARIARGDNCAVFEKDSDKADQSTSPVHKSMVRSIVVCELTLSCFKPFIRINLRARQIQHLDSIPVQREFNDKLAL